LHHLIEETKLKPAHESTRIPSATTTKTVLTATKAPVLHHQTEETNLKPAHESSQIPSVTTTKTVPTATKPAPEALVILKQKKAVATAESCPPSPSRSTPGKESRVAQERRNRPEQAIKKKRNTRQPIHTTSQASAPVTSTVLEVQDKVTTTEENRPLSPLESATLNSQESNYNWSISKRKRTTKKKTKSPHKTKTTEKDCTTYHHPLGNNYYQCLSEKTEEPTLIPNKNLLDLCTDDHNITKRSKKGKKKDY